MSTMFSKNSGRISSLSFCVETGIHVVSTVKSKMASSLVKQELPPKGGYPPIEYARNLPKRGPSGFMIFVGGAAVMAFGFYHVIMGNRRRCELMTEKMNARIGILPLLQAEHDRKCLRALKENEELEGLIMKDVPGWKVGESVYHTDKWVTPIAVQVNKI